MSQRRFTVVGYTAGVTGNAHRRATYQDVLDAPPHMVAELIDGELHLQPRPANPHAEAGSILGMLLGPPFRLGRGGPGGWWLQDEPELHLGEAVLVPDMAGWRRSDHPGLDAERTAAFYRTRPDWLAEVLSPSTQGHDRVRKLPAYAEAGVEWVWLIDPLRRTLEVFRRTAEGLMGLAAAYEAPELAKPLPVAPFEALELELGLMWAEIPEEDVPG